MKLWEDNLTSQGPQGQITGGKTRHIPHLETGALASTSLLLNWHDLHHFVLQRRAQEKLHYLVLLDGHGEQVNLLQRLNLALKENSKFFLFQNTNVAWITSTCN